MVSNVKHGWWLGFRPTYYVTFEQAPRGQGVLVAASVPARRAMRVDPITALRAE